jgi:SAM-dependent methyltransferase
VTVTKLEADDPAAYEPWAGQFESALCVNVLESVQDPQLVLTSLARCLKPNGSIVVLAPQGNGLFGTLDEGMGHRRRFSAQQLRKLLETAGFEVMHERHFNKIGSLSWWISGKIFRQRKMNRVALKLWDKTAGAVADRGSATARAE